VQIHQLASYILVLAFGAVITVYFAGYEKTKQCRKSVISIILMIFSLQLTSYYLVGFAATTKLYPLITHVPMVIFIERYLKKPRSIAIVSVLTAYLCCQPPNWLGIAAHYCWNSNDLAFFIGDSLGILIMFYLIHKYIAASVNQVMSYSRRSLYLFGSFPLIYYVFDYTTTIYTEFLYSGARVVVEFFPSVLSMFYIIFVIVYSGEMQKRNQLEMDKLMLEAKSEHALNEIYALQQVQNQTAVYRHDMRHHLTLLYGFLEAGDSEKATEYIRQTQSDIDRIVPARYCENATVSLILSAFATKAAQKGVTLDIEAVVPISLPFPDTEICTLLANGLENAITAAASGSDSSRKSRPPVVRVNCRVNKGNLLILIENTFSGQIEIKNGLPQTNKEGHGFGVKSIAILVDRHKGYYSFSVSEGLFTLKIVLPMPEK
jgi:hypothetical protein